jgi:thiamine monophosphate synthase
MIAHKGLRARAALLNAAAHRLGASRTAPFALAFLTDRRRIGNPEPILRALPPGTAVIYRDYDDPRRPAMAARYCSIARTRNLVFIVAGDAALARAVGADGVHYPQRMLCAIDRSAGLVSAACHDAASLGLAASRGADIAFLSPAFATKSHEGAAVLGAGRFKSLAAGAALPVLALGGVDHENALLLASPNVAGFGAIGAFCVSG